MSKQNPLLQPFDAAPFSSIKNEHFKPAFEHAIAAAKAEIDVITSNSEAPTFENTIEALEYTGQQLDRISSIFFNLNSAETNDEIQTIAQEVSPLLSEFSNDITLNESLFNRVKTVYENKNQLELTPEQQTLLDKKYKSFVRNGAHLSQEKKQQLRDIDKNLARLKLTFGENVLAETNKYILHITDEKELAGLPTHTIEAAAQTAEELKKTGWVFTLQYPSYIPFMTYADDRELRKKLAIAFGAKGFQNDSLDNQKNVLEIVKLRHQRAQLLGYETHAHFVLEERMAQSPQIVESFIEELLLKAKPAAKNEFDELSAFAKKIDGIDQLQKWD